MHKNSTRVEIQEQGDAKQGHVTRVNKQEQKTPKKVAYVATSKENQGEPVAGQVCEQQYKQRGTQRIPVTTII